MTFWLLIRRGLRFHARAHFGVVLGSAISSAALIGALVVGDSVRGSLRERALDRLRGVEYAMNTGDRFFREDLGDRLSRNDFPNPVRFGNSTIYVRLPSTSRTTAMQLPGTAARQDGRARANQVNVLGIDLVPWTDLGAVEVPLAPAPGISSGRDAALAQAGFTSTVLTRWAAGDLVFLNQALAKQLNVKEGDEVILRIRKPSLLAQDAVISPRDNTSLALRLKVGPTLPSDLLGDFSLAANQAPAQNAFLPLDLLAARLELTGRANLILNGAVLGTRELTSWEVGRLNLNRWMNNHWPSRGRGLGRTLFSWTWFDPFPAILDSPANAVALLAGHVQNEWSLDDAQLSVRSIEQPQTATGGHYVRPSIEISTSRIFLEPSIVTAALKPRSRLLNQHAGFTNDTTNDLDFSGFVTNGLGVLTYLANLIRDGDRATPYSMVTAAAPGLLPVDLRDDEILINDWLAEDLQAKPGDKIDLSYYSVDSASRLTERTNSFKVRAVVPLKGIYADRTLMPDFPGIAKAESTQDWDTGFPLVYKIRETDEAYWKRYRGTPKAFITLASGQAMWSSRFGTLTAIRYPVATNSFPEVYHSLVYRNLLANLAPAELGFRFEPVRERALRAAGQAQDFGQLFIGFSFFLVVAALLLMALLFQFSLERRRAEVGTLLALGLRSRQVRRLLLGEGVVLALLGAAAGAPAGIGYAKAMLWALTTVWRDAVGVSTLNFFASPATLLSGFLASTVVAGSTIWLTLRKQARHPARELLSPDTMGDQPRKGAVAKAIAVICGLAALAISAHAIAHGATANAEAFFEAGSLLLLAGLASASAWLAALGARSHPAHLSLHGMGLRACARRRRRSLATIALLACGSFVIVSIGVFRLDAARDADKRSSGTGGFALIGQAALPVVPDLNSQSGRDFFGLNPRDLAGMSVVPFRVRDGDEASCLNLNRAQKPRLLGVDPDLLKGRFTFAAAAKGEDIKRGWDLLRTAGHGTAMPAADEIPAIGDANSIQWALGKSLGDTIDYTDEQGRTLKLRLVGALANSVLQGSLIIDEAQFTRHFPGESGHRFFLVDSPGPATPEVSAVLSRALQDLGLELTPAAQRLNAFNAVQNTYLGTFQVLGGLGLLLGSAGLGVVVLRNVLERRGELGLLLAVGFRRRALKLLVLAEHSALLGLGLGLGLVAAVLAVLPALLSPAGQLPIGSLALTLAAVLLNGAAWTWLATQVALRGNLLAALRNE